ncbi:MAG: hypothetical protein IPJ74_18845 [Saprospiraceae bacterium]|nr:hypothetical protein [Saprospiraceae bacterium]
MQKYLLLLSFILLFFNGFGQDKLAIGQWTSHLPYVLGQWVTQSDERVYYATDWSVISFDKTERSTDYLSTVEGLSNTGIRLIKYVEGSDVLIIVYNNSVIDLVKPNEIFTLNQIRNFQGIVGEKVIYDIAVENDSTVYLAANYGVSKLNIRSNQFTFTTFTGIDTRSARVFEGNLYIATDDGIYRTSLNNPNIADITTWQELEAQQGFPFAYASGSMAIFQDALYFSINDTLFRFKEEKLEKVYFEQGFRLQFLTAEGAHLLAGYRCVSGCARGKILYFNADDSFGALATDCVGIPNYAVEDAQGRVWIGDYFREFRMVNSVTDPNCETTVINSPYSEFSREMTVYKNQLWLATGGVNQTFSYVFRDHGFASLIEGQWTIYNRFTKRELQGESLPDAGDDLFDFLTIAVHPDNGKVYAGSFFEGLIEVDGDKLTLFNEKNSSLGNAVGDAARTRISGLAFDEDNNLWISNHTADRPISVLQNNGEWKSFRPSCGVTEIHQVTVDQSGFKWFVTTSSSVGVMVFDEGDIENPADDRCRVFNQNNSNLPTNVTNCLTVDLDGDVWVGTAQGIVIFECGGSAFDPQCLGTLRVVELDGFGAYLLETQEIQAIAVDGANRKWIGTKTGVFVLSPSGEEQIARFTTDNSPLFDNNITDIAINQETGEVFIGTDKGIISYKSDAVVGGRLNKVNVEVFPNPVRPEHTGPIAIRGLARDANVKITDVAGRLVYETQALGGQAIWDGNDYNGRRAATGVYLVFSTTNARYAGFDKPDAVVAKIVIVN